MRIPVAKEGFIFIFLFFMKTIFVLLIGYSLLAGLFFLITLFVLFFFRDPERSFSDHDTHGADKKAIISPADGYIVQIKEMPAGEGLDVPSICLSVFMSVFNVHVNRMPFEGKIIEKKYNPGKFLPAFREKASLLNEQTTILIETPKGIIRVTQISGLIARRIVCKVKVGDTLVRGQRFGLIKFGSRVDLYLPKERINVAVSLKDKARAGETILAYFK